MTAVVSDGALMITSPVGVGAGAQLDLRHLLRMSDETGLFEHADGAIPRGEHGYCVDDVARGLLVLCREPFPTEAVVELSGRYLTFLAHAQAPDGSFHNRLGYDRLWHDEPSTGDWWGRALWGLGTAAAGSPAPWIRESALAFFDRGARLRSGHLRSMAFAALGAVQVLTVYPAHALARELLADTVLAIGGDPVASTSSVIGPRSGEPQAASQSQSQSPSQLQSQAQSRSQAQAQSQAQWPWPEQRLAYANAILPEVLIRAGRLLGDEAALTRGLRLLDWLLETETTEGHLSPAPVGGSGPGDRRPGFDQQPIEIAALADACATAYSITADSRWAEGVRRAAAWFAGDNDAQVAMYDPDTGGGYDGLTADGRNTNQGAESTLALLSTLQQDRRIRMENP